MVFGAALPVDGSAFAAALGLDAIVVWPKKV